MVKTDSGIKHILPVPITLGGLIIMHRCRTFSHQSRSYHTRNMDMFPYAPLSPPHFSSFSLPSGLPLFICLPSFLTVCNRAVASRSTFLNPDVASSRQFVIKYVADRLPLFSHLPPPPVSCVGTLTNSAIF